MKKEEFFRSKNGKIITAAVIVVILLAIIAAVVILNNKGEKYRSIAVQELGGTVTVAGDQNNGQAYVGEHLYSGDDVTVAEESNLTLCMDNEKYLYADANTHFSLQASSPSEPSIIRIYMDEGSELNVLPNKLGPNDVYEVDTPNSTMSVRGTIFRVTVYKSRDGMRYTLVEVEEGTVNIRLKTDDGTYNGTEKDFTAGQSALIRGNSEISEFVVSGEVDLSDLSGESAEDKSILMLAYDSLPKDSIERLITLLYEGGMMKADDPDVAKYARSSKSAGADEVTPTPSLEKEEVSEVASESEPTPTAGPTPTTHVHNPGDWTVKTPAGCETPGVEERKCKECGQVVETRAIAATGHVPGNWVDTIPADCETGGTRQQLCANCGAVLATEATPPKGHDWSGWYEEGEVTCTSGCSKSRSCSNCGAVETGYEGALGHDWYATGNSRKTIGSLNVPDEFEYACSRCGATEWRD